MNWLTKIGTVAAKMTAILTGFGPLISAVHPSAAAVVTRVESEIEQAIGIVAQAEIMGAALKLPGAQKLEMAAPAMAQLILRSSMMAGKKISDPVKFAAGCKAVADGFAQIANSLDGDVKSEEKA